MQVSIKTIVKERGKFSITFNGLQWAYSREWCFMENVLPSFDNSFNRYLRFFVVMTYFSVHTNADRSWSNFTYISVSLNFHQCTFRHCRAYLKFYFICTLNAQKYAHLSSGSLLFLKLYVNLNLKFKSQFRKVSVLLPDPSCLAFLQAPQSFKPD